MEKEKPPTPTLRKFSTGFAEEFLHLVQKKGLLNPLFITILFLVLLLIIFVLIIFNINYDKWPLVTALISISFTYFIYLANNYDIRRIGTGVGRRQSL